MMDAILVTGGCGFIGANLVPRLVQLGHDIRILDNLSRGRQEYLAGVANVEIIEDDIRNPKALANAVRGADAVIHLAAFGSVIESVHDPVESFDINVHGTFNVLNACRNVGVPRLIFASTGGALIGNADPPVNERSLPRPISPYGSSKLCGEAYCSAFSESYGMKISALRFANVFGPYSGHKKGAVTAFMKALSENWPIQIYGDGSATRDFLYVDDICDGIAKALHTDLEGFNVMHLASGGDVTVVQLAKLIMETAGRNDHPIRYIPRRKGEVERNFASYDVACRLIGFKPRNDLREGLRKTWHWFEKNGF